MLRGDSTLIAFKSYDQHSSCEEAGQVKPSQAADRLPGQDRKSVIFLRLKRHHEHSLT